MDDPHKAGHDGNEGSFIYIFAHQCLIFIFFKNTTNPQSLKLADTNNQEKIMNKLKLSAACASLVLCTYLVSPAHAAETMALDPITIEAPMISYPATSSYTLDGKAPSARPYSDGADYLQSLPGITASRFGGHGLDVFLRGQSEGRVNVVSGETYTFGGCPNRMDPPTAYLNLGAQDEITVVRGYQSVLNGFGGTGGSIIVEQEPPEFGEDLSHEGFLSGGYDSNSDTQHAGARFTAGTAEGYAKAYASYKNAENYEDGDGDQVRSAFEERSGGVMLGYTPEGTHLYAGIDFHRIDDALFPGSGMDSPLSEGKTFKAGLEHEVGGEIINSWELSGYASLVDHVMDNYSLRPQTAALPLLVDSDSDTYGLKLESDLNFGVQPVEGLIEWRRNNRNADRFRNDTGALQSLLWPDITIDEIGLALETTYDLGMTSRVIAGGRYDYVHADYGRANEAAPAGGGLSPNNIYTQFYGTTASAETEHNLGGLLRLEHDMAPDTMLYAGLSRAVRTADATERGLANYMGTGGAASWVGNPDIKPEKHHQLDAGVEWQTSRGQFGSSVYANLVQDYILRDSARTQSGILVNFPNADVYRNVDAFLTGFELHGQWQLAPDWTVTGDATYTFGEDIDAGQALPQIPPLQGKIGLTWQALDYLELGTTMHWAMKQSRVDTNPLTGTGRDVGKTGGYAVFDLEGTLTEIGPASLNFGVTNIFDKTYASHLNRSNISDPTEIQVNEPGRSFYLQLSIPF